MYGTVHTVCSPTWLILNRGLKPRGNPVDGSDEARMELVSTTVAETGMDHNLVSGTDDRAILAIYQFK